MSGPSLERIVLNASIFALASVPNLPAINCALSPKSCKPAPDTPVIELKDASCVSNSLPFSIEYAIPPPIAAIPAVIPPLARTPESEPSPGTKDVTPPVKD